MRITAVSWLVLVVSLAAPVAARPADGPSFLGEWTATASTPGGDVSETIKAVRRDNGYAITVKLVVPPPEGTPEAGPGTDIVLDGDKFSYKRSITTPGGTLTTGVALVLARVEHVPPVRFFKPEEARTLRAFCDVVTAQDSEPRVPVLSYVDEKLQATLEQRLGASFRHVSERLEQVHRGLGEMQSLATGVGDLKRVLTNVKSRGTWGEVQLGTLLADVLPSGQYAQNVATRPGSNERVASAIEIPITPFPSRATGVTAT